MILFPSRPDRTFLLCFWLSLVISAGLLFLIIFAYLDASLWFFWGFTLIFIFFLIGGYLLPNIILFAYEAWRNAASLFVRLSRLWLIGVCFYIALIFMGRTDSFLNLKRPSTKTSMWFPWIIPGTDMYSTNPIGISPINPYRRHWVYTFITWAKKPRHLWAFSLLPFILLFRVLQIGQKSDFPTSIYTLY